MPTPSAEAQTVYQGKRFAVKDVHYRSRSASGGTLRREVVVPANAVVVLPVLDGDRVVLIRNERFAVDEVLWEIPAGTLEEGEDPQACAERELTEETGYTAKNVRRLCEFYTAPGFCTEMLTAYVAEGLTHGEQSLDDTEDIEVHVTPLAEALEMIRDNRIRDAKTIATLLYYTTFLGVNR